MNDMMLQNILYSLLFIASGLVILFTFSRFKMRVARVIFIPVFLVIAMYIPFYFGGSAMSAIFSTIFKDEYTAQVFTGFMAGTFSAPFVYFKAVSTGAALLAFVISAAGAITAVYLTRRIVKYVRTITAAKKEIAKKARPQIRVTLTYIENYQNTYKKYLRLLN